MATLSDPTLATLIADARAVTMTSDQRESQRQSFAFGNTLIENECITRNHIAAAAKRVDAAKKDEG